jgi:hypothetical protein
MSALVTGGPGTPASAADLARYVRDFDPEQVIGLAPTDSEFTLAAAVAAAVADDTDEANFVEIDADADFDRGVVAFDDDGLDASDFGDDEDEDEDEDFDELSIEELFLNVTAMWSVLGAIDEDDRLTPLGWWGLPEAMNRAWTEPESE